MTPPRIQIQDRDLKILRMLYDSRLMSAVQIAAVLEEPYSQGLERRLLALHKARYLDRPANQEAYRLAPTGRLNGRLHLVYALGDLGAQLLARSQNLKLSKSSWARLNREIKTTQINHALAVSNFRAALYSAMPQGTGKFPYHWAQGRDLRMEYVEKRQKGFGSREVRHVVHPDAFCALNVPGQNDQRAGLYFFVEMDRSTMEHKRMLAKYRAYWVLWREGLIRKHFQVEHAVVLTVCKSRRRRDSLAALAKRADDRQSGSRLFRFASETDFSLESPQQILEPIWLAAGEKEFDQVW